MMLELEAERVAYLGSGAELDDVFASQRAARDRFKAAHPEVVARIERLFGR